MIHKIALISLSLLVAACGGGGGGSGSSNKATSHVRDGIYLNNTDLVVMLVDTGLTNAAMVVGDYVDNSVYFTDTHTVTNNTLKTKGLTYASTSTYIYDSALEIETEFDQQGATLTTVVNNQNVVYSFDRAPASAQLDVIAGTHINPDDGSTWIINADGSFIINGVCTISGTMKRVKDYFLAKNVEAVSCDDPDFDSSNYEARILTVNQAGTTYILSAMANPHHVIWGSVPI